MSKITRNILIGVGVVAAIAGVIALVNIGRQYYNDRYVSSDYYAQVPADYDITPKQKFADDGSSMGDGVDYNLIAYNEKGESKEVHFDIMDKNSGWATASEYLQPGTYLLVKASEQLVTGWSVVSKDKVPAAVLEKLEAK
jgi:uncharacterized protein (TIGR01655 family)